MGVVEGAQARSASEASPSTSSSAVHGYHLCSSCFTTAIFITSDRSNDVTLRAMVVMMMMVVGILHSAAQRLASASALR